MSDFYLWWQNRNCSNVDTNIKSENDFQLWICTSCKLSSLFLLYFINRLHYKCRSKSLHVEFWFFLFSVHTLTIYTMFFFFLHHKSTRNKTDAVIHKPIVEGELDLKLALKSCILKSEHLKTWKKIICYTTEICACFSFRLPEWPWSPLCWYCDLCERIQHSRAHRFPWPNPTRSQTCKNSFVNYITWNMTHRGI